MFGALLFELPMPPFEIGLVARAKALSRRLVSRDALERLAETGDLAGFARGLARLGAAIDPLGESPNLLAIERAVERTASRHIGTLDRWQTRSPGVLDVFNADRERRSLRAVLRGAVQGAPLEARIAGLLPTPSLPLAALVQLARQGSAAAVVRQLIVFRHPHAPRLLALAESARPNLMAIEVVLLEGYADRATRAAAGGDQILRQFVHDRIDVINAQTAVLMSGGPRELTASDGFVEGGRWLAHSDFVSASSTESQGAALAYLRTALATTPLAAMLGGAVGHIDRMFLALTLKKLTRTSRLAPLSSAPLIRVLLRIEAQSHDLRALAWAAFLDIPAPLRKQQLVTPS